MFESGARDDGFHLRVALHIVCEVICIFESQGYSRDEIYNALRDFSRIGGIEFVDGDALLEAAVDYRAKNIVFSDALLATISGTQAEKVWAFLRLATPSNPGSLKNVLYSVWQAGYRARGRWRQ